MFSQTAIYVLRAVTFLARRPTEAVPAKEIAEAANIPLQYLQKILTGLARGGLLSSTRGIGGGFRLTRAPEDLGLAEVLEATDPISIRTGCPFGNAECGEGVPCPAHERWSKVQEAYREFLESTTLAELASGRGRISSW